MINKALRVFRQYSELTQLELSNKLEITKNELIEIEKGTKTPSIDILKRYSKVFDVSLESLFFFSENLNRSEKEIPKKFRLFLSDKIIKAMEWKVRKNEEKSLKA